MELEIFVIHIDREGDVTFSEKETLQTVKSANTIYVRSRTDYLTLNIWLKINYIGNVLKAECVNLEHFNILEFPEDVIKVCIYSTVNIMNCTNTLVFVKYLSESRTLNHTGLKSLGFYSYFGGEKTSTVEYKKSLIPLICRLEGLDNLTFEYKGDLDTKYSEEYTLANSILNRILMRNLIAWRKARKAIMTFLLANRHDRDSSCYIFPKEIASKISMWAFRSRNDWIPEDISSKEGIETITSEFKEYSKHLSEKECLHINFTDSSNTLNEHIENRVKVNELIIECVEDDNKIELPYVYDIFSLCIKSETISLTFNNINFHQLRRYGRVNPRQTYEQMPNDEDLIATSIGDSRYRSWKLETIQFFNCYTVYWFLKLFLKIMTNKTKFTFRHLKLEDFSYGNNGNYYPDEKENETWVPVVDSVQICIDWVGNYIDITRL